jgi:hypothetical protein
VSDDEERVALKRACVDLLFEVPGCRQAPDCPLGEVRTRTLLERIMWLRSLSLDELRQLMSRHRRCVRGDRRRRPPQEDPG